MPDSAKSKIKKLVFVVSPLSMHQDWLARNQDNVSVWSDMSNRGLLFQRANTIKV